MARVSKSQNHPFTIYEDTGIPTPDSSYQPSFDDAVREADVQFQADGRPAQDLGDLVARECDNEHGKQRDGLCNVWQGGDEHADDQRRVSAITGRTSVSSLPEWVDQTDNEQKPYTPPIIRPSFMRPESVRRMQMVSPPPFSPRSPRQSILRHSRSRAGTPQSMHSSVNAHGSPRSRRHDSVESKHTRRESNAKQYPLVLLHVTLLAIQLPWSAEAMQEILPERVFDQLRVLKGKVSETLLQRGLLIPHPREEYELLEERLLEALELREERLNKCGHFRGHARDSTSSVSTIGDSDSGLGSGTESADGEVCSVCHHHLRDAKSAGGRGKWTVKVYAANGLMRAPAWAAAWSEMERVDVEILPFISDDAQKRLDARQEQYDVEERARVIAEDEKACATFDEQRRSVQERAKRDGEVQERMAGANPVHRHDCPAPSQPDFSDLLAKTDKHPSKSAVTDLPQIYRPSEIPLSVLMKNYILLLARDRRNVVIFFLALVALSFGMGNVTNWTSIEEVGAIAPLEEACLAYQLHPGLSLSDLNATAVEVKQWGTEGVSETVVVEVAATDEDERDGKQRIDWNETE